VIGILTEVEAPRDKLLTPVIDSDNLCVVGTEVPPALPPELDCFLSVRMSPHKN